MNVCPNPNSPEWKALVELIGEEQAYIEFTKYNEIPPLEYYQSSKKETVRLYRIENKNIPYDESREGIVSKKEIVGGFFTDSINTVSNYIRKNQSQEGITLVYVDIDKNDLDKYHVSKNEYAKNMDVESDNWIIPQNIDKNYVDLKNLSKVTGNFMTLSKAKSELSDIIKNLPQNENPQYLYNTEAKETPLTDDALFQHSNEFYKRFKVNVDIVSREQADKLGIDKNAKGAWEGNSNRIFLVKGSGLLTALHEFTHPFVEYISKQFPNLYKTLKADLLKEGEDRWKQFLIERNYGNLIKDGQITENGWKEIITSQIESASRDILDNTNIDTKFQNSVRIFWKKIKEMLSNLLNVNFNSEKDVMNLTIKDLGMLMLNPDFKLDLSKVTTESLVNASASTFFFQNAATSFTSALQAQVKSYKQRTGKDITDSQNKVLNILLSKQHLISSEKEYYDSLENVNLKRATEFINEIPGPNGEIEFFKYKSEEDLGGPSRAWGNQIDKLSELILLGVDKTTAISEVIDYFNNTAESEEQKEYIVSEDVLSSLYDELSSIFETKYKDYIQVPQVILSNNEIKVAGRTDILLISPEGRLKIIDVKTTVKSMYDFNNQKYKESGSSKQRYTAQLTVYKALAKSMGLEFEEASDLSLIPITLELSEDKKVVEEATIQPEINIASYNYILKMFNEEGTLAINEFNSSKEGELINRMKVLLQEKLDNIKRLPDNLQKKYSEKETKDLIDLINQAEPIKKLTEFVNSIYAQFQDTSYVDKSGKTRTKYGIASQISYLGTQLDTGKISKEEALSKINYIKSIRDLYAPILSDIRFAINSKEDNTLKSEMFNKLSEIETSISIINDVYEQQGINILTDILSQGVSESANETVIKQVEALKKRIQNEQDPKKKERYKKELDSFTNKVGSEQGITKEVIRKALKEGSQNNISILDRWLTPAASSSNELIGTFSRVLKDKLEDARQSLIDFEKKAANAFTKVKGSKDNPAEFNKGLYEEVSFFDKLDDQGNPVFKKRMVFTSEIDIDALERAKAKHAQAISKADPKNIPTLNRAFYKENYELRPRKDIIINGVVIEKGLDTLLEEKKKLLSENIISESEYKGFEKSLNGYSVNGITYYNRDLLLPKKSKFPNKVYAQLQGEKKEYYNFLISSYFNSQKRLPSKMGYVIPSIPKSGFDAVAQGGLKNYLSYEWQNFKTVTEEDVSKYGEKGKVIPMPYNFDMDAKDVSLDLIQSIVMYEAESLEYEAKAKVADAGEILLNLVESKGVFKSDDVGNKYIDKFAEQAGVTDELLKYKKIYNGNNVAALLNVYIDAQIYGKLSIKTDAKVLGVNLDKLVNGIMTFASMTQVGGNPIGSVANKLQANLQANIESAAGDRISGMSWQKAKLIYNANVANYIKDFNEPYNKSFIGQLIDNYDPMQGEYKDAAGRKISKSMFKKMWSTNTWFFMQYIGEHSVQVETMIAMMLDTKVILKDGTSTNLYEMHKQQFEKNGEIKVQEGAVGLGKLSANGRISRDFQASLHALNKRLQGVYNKQDKPDIERYWWGKLLTMYKKFLAPGLKRRYKSAGIDFEYGDLTEGYWITFQKKLLSDAKELGKFIVGANNGYFTEFEKQNLRRARRELLIVALTGFAVIGLKALMEGADDEEKRFGKYLLFLSLRMNNELGIYGTFGDPQNFGLPNPLEIYKSLKNPAPALSVVDKAISLLTQLTDPSAVYKQDSGVWEKGDSKLWAKFLKFWGFNGTNFDPENSIKYMQMTTK